MDTIIDRESKLPKMIMSGDHPSFTRAELNLKDAALKVENTEKDNDKISSSFARISPTPSRTAAPAGLPAAGAGAGELDHAAAAVAAARCRWPPYLVAAWLVALALAHALHAALALLDRALPLLRIACSWSRAATLAAWREAGAARAVAVAALAAALHALCAAAAAARALSARALQPLADADALPPGALPAGALPPGVYDARVTNYDEDSQMSPHLKTDLMLR